MKKIKTQAVVVGLLVSGVALLATKAAQALHKGKCNKLREELAPALSNLSFEVQELRDTLLRSDAYNVKLREHNEKMYTVLKDYENADLSVLLEVGEPPEADVSVDEKVASVKFQIELDSCLASLGKIK